MFKDSDTNQLDTDQQQAFKVIVSKFVLPFHDKANCNEGMHTTGMQHPTNHVPYNMLKSQLKTISRMTH